MRTGCAATPGLGIGQKPEKKEDVDMEIDRIHGFVALVSGEEQKRYHNSKTLTPKKRELVLSFSTLVLLGTNYCMHAARSISIEIRRDPPDHLMRVL